MILKGMRQILEGLFQSDVEHPFNNAVCTAAYFAARAEGNILFYSSSFIERHFDFLEGMGGIATQYVSHRHEASEYCDKVSRTSCVSCPSFRLLRNCRYHCPCRRLFQRRLRSPIWRRG